jgi:predicted alpha/beta hydrolase
VTLFQLGLALTCLVPFGIGVYLISLSIYLRVKYVKIMVRIFQEKPLFVVPRGEPLPEAEDVTFRSRDGVTLRGCYLTARQPRRGVILFGLEFGSNRWSCRPYVEHLLDAGFDVFAFETRNQGESGETPGYDPLQWVTDYEVADARAALAYLKARPDADPRGVGFFGISKGGSAGLFLAAADRTVRCCVTDGAFGTYTTLVPYMRKFFKLYNQRYGMQMILPSWYFGMFGLIGLMQIERKRHCHFPHLEGAMRRLRQPLLMIHGEADAYIRPNMARALFGFAASATKDFWLAPDSKHNQALHEHSVEYRRRVLEFFEAHLAERAPVHVNGAAMVNGECKSGERGVLTPRCSEESGG